MTISTALGDTQKGNDPLVFPQEVERKWLISVLPDFLGTLQGFDIVQGYIAIAVDGTEVRLRQKAGRFFQTVKSAGELVRGEIEIELLEDQFQKLWASTEGRRLEKTRYEIPSDNRIIELDIYRGSLQGLMVAQVEFLSVDEAKAFFAPQWFGKEITEVNKYKNRNLACNGMLSDE